MDAMEWNLAVCDVMSQGALLVIWLGVLGVSFALWKLIHWMPSSLRRAVVVSVLVVGGLLGGPANALAVPPNYPGGACAWMNNQEWPCWIIEAMWCPCTWDDPPPPG